MTITIKNLESKRPVTAWRDIPGGSWFLGHIQNGGIKNSLNFKATHNFCVVYKDFDAHQMYPWDMRNKLDLTTVVVADYVPLSVELIATKESK